MCDIAEGLTLWVAAVLVCWFDIELKSKFYVGVFEKYSVRAADKLHSPQQQLRALCVRSGYWPSVCELETVLDMRIACYSFDLLL